MRNIIGPAPVDFEATHHLLDALRAECLGDSTAFAAAFEGMQRDWDHDPLGTLASTTLVSATAVRHVVHPGPPVRILLASTLGRVAQQRVPDHLMIRAVEVVFRFAEAAGPNLVDAFGVDPLTWRQAGAVMAAFTTGLILANQLETDTPPGETIDRLVGALRGSN